VTIVN